MTMSSSFYLAAIPHIYRESRVSSSYASFFLHTPFDHDSASNLHTMSSAELVKAGHTKLAALRHVRQLHITFPPKLMGPDYQNVSHHEKLVALREYHEAVAVGMSAAEANLRTLPVGCMPNLECLRDGEEKRREDTQPRAAAAVLAELILARSTPRCWCQYHDQRITPETLRTLLVGMDDPSRKPITLHRHIRINNPFSIIPGSINYVYIHRTYSNSYPDEDRTGQNVCRRGEWIDAMNSEDPEDVGRWLGKEIRETFESVQISQTSIDNTRIVIGGAAKIMRSSKDSEEGWSELDRSRKAILAASKVLGEGSQAHLGGVKFEARTAQEMPSSCPVCGAWLDGC